VTSLGTQVAALPELYGSKGRRDAAWYERQQKRWGEEKTWDPDSWAATKTERTETLLNPNLPYDKITNPYVRQGDSNTPITFDWWEEQLTPPILIQQ